MGVRLESGDALLAESGSAVLLEQITTPPTIPGAIKPTQIVSELPAGATAATYQKPATLVELLIDGHVEATLDTVTDGEVILDANNSILGRLTLSVVGLEGLIPTGPDSDLAPYGPEIRAYRGLELSDRTLLVPLGTFRIDQANGDETIAITGQDRAAKFSGQDGCFENSGQVLSGADALDTIRFLLASVDPDIVFDFPDIDVPLPALFFEEGQDRWEFCRGIATSLGGTLYFDRNGAAAIRKIAATLGGLSVATIAEGEGGVLLEANRNLDRADVFNRVVVKGENPDSTDIAPRGEAIDDDPRSPTYYFGGAGGFGQKTYPYSSTFISTNEQADDAAAGILARVTGAPDVINFQAIVDPARSPGDIVHIKRDRLEIDENHILDSVTIPLASSGTMSATTRATRELL